MLKLRTTHKKAQELLTGRIEKIKEIRKDPKGRMELYDVLQWVKTTSFVLEEIYKDDRHEKGFSDSLQATPPPYIDPSWEPTWALNCSWAILNSYLDEIDF